MPKSGGSEKRDRSPDYVKKTLIEILQKLIDCTKNISSEGFCPCYPKFRKKELAKTSRKSCTQTKNELFVSPQHDSYPLSQPSTAIALVESNQPLSVQRLSSASSAVPQKVLSRASTSPPLLSERATQKSFSPTPSSKVSFHPQESFQSPSARVAFGQQLKRDRQSSLEFEDNPALDITISTLKIKSVPPSFGSPTSQFVSRASLDHHLVEEKVDENEVRDMLLARSLYLPSVDTAFKSLDDQLIQDNELDLRKPRHEESDVCLANEDSDDDDESVLEKVIRKHKTASDSELIMKMQNLRARLERFEDLNRFGDSVTEQSKCISRHEGRSPLYECIDKRKSKVGSDDSSVYMKAGITENY